MCAPCRRTRNAPAILRRSRTGSKKIGGGYNVWCNPPYGRQIGEWVKKAAESGAPVTELLQRIYTCIADSYDDCSFSLQDVAAKLDLSSGYLSQYFKQQTGDTLTSYVADLRIRKACSLLESTTMPLQMVSESVGYYNLNSFIRRFKQITGLTPGEYRKTRQ